MLAFNNKGLLPPEDYSMTFKELKSSLLVVGPPNKQLINWDVNWRLHLVSQLEILTKQLWEVGINEIFIDGSFVEMKPHPNDIDGYFECDLMYLASGRLEQELNKLDPNKIWTWNPNSRKPYRGYAKKQLPMWHKYRVELYPHVGLPSGIKDQHGNNLQFPAAFRIARYSNEPKGVIKLVR
ncbi:hypothetical protein Ga0451573_001348 [Peptococcaceae bacterium DYL19]|nr:hypothetical protein [Phosphitispora fastidiosa]